MAEQFYYNSTYALQENKFGLGVELEGAELIPFPTTFFSSSSAVVRPVAIPTSSTLRIPVVPNNSTLSPMSSTQEHHVMPNQVKDHPVVREAREGGFEQDGKENKMPVEKFDKSTGEGRHGNHPKYNQEMDKKLTKYQNENPTRTKQQSTEFVRKTVSETKELINSKPSTKINDLFNQKVMATDNTRTSIVVDKTKINPCNGNPNCL